MSALASLALLGTGLAGPAEAAYAGADGRIAFVRGGDIYTIQPNGTGLRRLTRNGHSSGPRWSPTGARIAYLRSGNLWIMNANGGHKTRITNAAPAYTDARPTWSPNGRYLAFVKTARGRSWGYLTRYNTVTRTLRTFTTTVSGRLIKVPALPTGPAWQLAVDGSGAGSFLLFEGARSLCAAPFTHCLVALGFGSQSQYANGFPSSEYSHADTTRFLDPDWYPNSPPFATGVMVTVERCPPRGRCTHTGIEPSLDYPLPPVALPGAYQAVFSPSASFIAYVKNVSGTPEVFVTPAGSSPVPGKPLVKGAEPDWQPLPPPANPH